MSEKRTEYGEVINKKVLGQLHNSPKHNFTVQDVAGGSSASADLKALVEGTLTSFVNEDIASVKNDIFYGYTSFVTVELPNVTSIGNSAFCGCTSLTSIELPNVTEIGEGAFCGCTSLASVSLPSVTEIGMNAFFECSSLASVTIDQTTPPTVGVYAFFDGEVIISGLKIYVPADAVATYKADSNWSIYEEVIEAIPEESNPE